MLVKSKEDITPVLVNLYAILSWNKYYNMIFLLYQCVLCGYFEYIKPICFEQNVRVTPWAC